MSKFSDPIEPREHECPRCHQVLQPLRNGITHRCPKAKDLRRDYEQDHSRFMGDRYES